MPDLDDMSAGQRASHLADQHLSNGDATGWFDKLYARASADGSGVPWAQMRPHPDFAEWLANDDEGLQDGSRALVVGCGLGDDAVALAGQGYTVTAFDVAQNAIDLCQQRFPDAPVTWRAADLFHPPAGWQTAFDLVVEIITVQSLPPHLQEDALRRIAGFVAPGGRLFVGSSVRVPKLSPSGPPWPLNIDLLDILTTDLPFSLINHKTSRMGPWNRVWQVQNVYRRS